MPAPRRRSVLRRALVTAIAGCLLAVTAAVPAGAAVTPQSRSAAAARKLDAQRADALYSALWRYESAGHGLVHERYPVPPGDNPYSYEWPYSQVHVAALDLAAADPSYRAEAAARSTAQEHYWKADGGTTGLPGYASYVPPPLGNSGDFFYDDNEWVGLAKMQWYAQTKDAASLSRAEQIFDLVVSGWDDDSSHPAPGGVFWTQQPGNFDRNTVSNMPGALLGLRLYQATHVQRYLTWATKMYDWTNANLQSPSGLYWDHLSVNGTIDKTEWSYNQGVPIGVNVAFYEVTHKAMYLKRAEHIADASYTYYVLEKRLLTQPVFFNSIFFKNLLLLSSVNGDPRYAAAMRTYANVLWDQQRDPATGLMHFDSDGTTESIQQAGTVQLFALLAWPDALRSTIS